MRHHHHLLLKFLIALTLTAMATATSDPFCKTGIRARQACCPKICNHCGGANCGTTSERFKTDCCPTSILTGARLCTTKKPPCKLAFSGNEQPLACPRVWSRVWKRAAGAPGKLRRVVRRFKRRLRESGGVRILDWEGGAPFALPRAYYNDSGVLFESRGNYHAVSNAPGTLDDRFSSYLPHMVVSNFRTYSGSRLFTPVMDNRLGVKFVKYGGKARVNGFGAVFIDAGTAVMNVFDDQGCLIRSVNVPRKRAGLSFVGVFAKGIAKVELELGNVSVSVFARRFRKSAVGDVVVLDDFIFGKPY